MLKRPAFKQLVFTVLLGCGFVALAPSPGQAGNAFGLSIGSHGHLGVTAAHEDASHRGTRSHSRRHSRPPSHRRHESSIAVFFGSGAFGYGHHNFYPYTAKHMVRYLPIHRLVAGVRAGTYTCYQHIAAKRFRLRPHRLKYLYAAGHGAAIRCYAFH